MTEILQEAKNKRMAEIPPGTRYERTAGIPPEWKSTEKCLLYADTLVW